ncbi:hypothetical protein ABDD95_22235 [Mucilaginibacter sp. PAMB04274]|uniref:outer membrane beta-barrel protein n=1 Tax=Mucilaginibacter sp. PAMB04274 TaxID=3138568 RepID=UPI0031F614DF
MKEQEEKDLDHLFKQGLTNPDKHINYDDRDWQAMAQMLDAQRKRNGLIRRLPAIISGLAAILLITFGMVFFWPKQPKHEKNIVKIKNHKQHPGTSDQDKQHLATPPAFADTGINRLKSTVMRVKGSSAKALLNASAAVPGRYAAGLKTTVDSGTIAKTNPDAAGNTLSQANADTSHNAAVLTTGAMVANNAAVKANNDTAATANTTVAVKETQKPAIKTAGANLPLTLTIIAAPDFNGVGSAFNRTKVGTNAGLLVSVGISRKFTVSTGAIYAQKPYMVNFSQYQSTYQFGTQPTDVTADCRVLDIPINVSYQLYSKNNRQLSIGTGLSSYFMLRENYQFNYPTAGYYSNKYTGPASYNISNQNKHVLGVLNLNVAYQQRINNSFGLNIQPYMKVPLTDIGYGRVNLQSTGVAVGLSWYVSPPSKTK